MSERIQDKVMRSLDAAEILYNRLVFLVGESGSGKTAILHEVAEKLGVEIINVNLALSARLLELTAKQRVLRLPDLLNEITESETVVLDNLEILFDKELKQDPVRLLQGISRNRCVVASWNGRIDKGKLIYAEIGHPEYRSYEMVDALIVGMDGTVSVDSIKRTREAGHA